MSFRRETIVISLKKQSCLSFLLSLSMAFPSRPIPPKRFGTANLTAGPHGSAVFFIERLVMAQHTFDVILRLCCVIGVAGLIAAGTHAPELPAPANLAQARQPSSYYKPGDLVPSSVNVISDNGYERSYGIAIIEGKTILVVDRESRRVIEVLQ